MRLTSLFALAVMAGIWTESAAQTQTPIDSWWNIVDPKWAMGVTVAPLTPTGPLDTLAQPVPPVTLTGALTGGLTSAITFPVSPIAYAMTGLRISMTMSGTNWKMTDPTKPFQLDVTFVAPTSVPAGVCYAVGARKRRSCGRSSSTAATPTSGRLRSHPARQPCARSRDQGLHRQDDR